MNNKVFFMDCMEGMEVTPDNFYDLAIVDPNYGINATNMSMGSNPNRSGISVNGEKQYPGVSTAVKLKGRLNSGGEKLKNRILNTSEIDWDDAPPPPEYFKELFRVSKHQIIWGGNYFIDNLYSTRCIIMWDKLQPWDNFSQWEMAWTSFDKPAKVYRISNTGGANRETKIHPTQKPVLLYDKIYKDFVTAGMNILDTHVGSGSHRQTAYRFGVDFIGYENNTIHFDDQEKRFNDFILLQNSNYKLAL